MSYDTLSALLIWMITNIRDYGLLKTLRDYDLVPLEREGNAGYWRLTLQFQWHTTQWGIHDTFDASLINDPEFSRFFWLRIQHEHALASPPIFIPPEPPHDTQ